MANSWHPKDPGDTRDYRIDYASFLPPDDPIASVDITLPVDLTLVNPAVVGDTDVVLRLSGGVLDNTYDVLAVATTESGQIFPARLALKVAERIVR